MRVVPRLLLALLTVLGAVVVGFWIRLLLTPHMVERVEVHVLALVLWWRDGLLPYRSPNGLPFLQNPYGPVYEWLCARLPDLVHPYFVGRLISLAAVLWTLGLVTWSVRRHSGSATLAAICALLPLTAKPFLGFAVVYRVDSLGLALAVTGFVLVTTRPFGRALVVAAVCFALAFATKMTFVAAAGASVVWLWRVDRRRALTLALLVVAGTTASVVTMELLSDGAYLGSIAFGNGPVRPLKCLDMMLRPGLSLLWLAALGVAILKRGGVEGRCPAWIYTILCLVVAAAFAANPLSSWNYLLELYVALALLTGELLSDLPSPRGLCSPRLCSPPMLLLAHVVVSLPLVAGWMYRNHLEIRQYRGQLGEARTRIEPWLTRDPRIVVLDSVAGSDVLNALGEPNAVAATSSLRRSPELLRLLGEALDDGRFRVALVGDDLRPCHRRWSCLMPEARDEATSGDADVARAGPGTGPVSVGARSGGAGLRDRTALRGTTRDRGARRAAGRRREDRL